MPFGILTYDMPVTALALHRARYAGYTRIRCATPTDYAGLHI
ncbi:MAG: hypothetical protein ABIY38_06920 [Rhodococcus sp. (in: high G+C Gram-positive bacteria)]